jgi:hypothetical protein
LAVQVTSADPGKNLAATGGKFKIGSERHPVKTAPFQLIATAIRTIWVGGSFGHLRQIDRGDHDACWRRQGETVRLRDALKRLFSEVFTHVSLATNPFTIAMAASAMPATIKQSLIAVTPGSLARNLQSIFFEPFVGVEPFCRRET